MAASCLRTVRPSAWFIARTKLMGQAQITATRPPGAGGVSGQGAVVTMTFMAKADGQTPLTITRGGARDPGLQAITVNGAQAAMTIQ